MRYPHDDGAFESLGGEAQQMQGARHIEAQVNPPIRCGARGSGA